MAAGTGSLSGPTLVEAADAPCSSKKIATGASRSVLKTDMRDGMEGRVMSLPASPAAGTTATRCASATGVAVSSEGVGAVSRTVKDKVTRGGMVTNQEKGGTFPVINTVTVATVSSRGREKEGTVAGDTATVKTDSAGARQQHGVM